jgi:hypothetical protein
LAMDSDEINQRHRLYRSATRRRFS